MRPKTPRSASAALTRRQVGFDLITLSFNITFLTYELFVRCRLVRKSVAPRARPIQARFLRAARLRLTRNALRKAMESGMTPGARCSSGTRDRGDDIMRTEHRKPTILCVDNEPDTLVILRLFLSANGFMVVCASSAEEALRYLAQCLPDFIITDCKMRGMHGLELCRTLRACQATRLIPILLHTGTPLPAHSSLYEGVFLKPASLDGLAQEVRALLAAKRPLSA